MSAMSFLGKFTKHEKILGRSQAKQIPDLYEHCRPIHSRFLRRGVDMKKRSCRMKRRAFALSEAINLAFWNTMDSSRFFFESILITGGREIRWDSGVESSPIGLRLILLSQLRVKCVSRDA